MKHIALYAAVVAGASLPLLGTTAASGVDKATLGNGRIRLTWTWQIRNGTIISFY
jgi:hypothetical protein